MGRLGSNQRSRDQNPMPYHLATPQKRKAPQSLVRGAYYRLCLRIAIGFSHKITAFPTSRFASRKLLLPTGSLQIYYRLSRNVLALPILACKGASITFNNKQEYSYASVLYLLLCLGRRFFCRHVFDVDSLHHDYRRRSRVCLQKR